ncbi:MAG: cell division protein FtsW [Chloroflexi bacterium]|nr:MAG: cell division protein FtsW [Chloroflexota bacterium]
MYSYIGVHAPNTPIHHYTNTQLMATVNIVRKKTNRVQTGIKFRFDYWMLLAVGGLIVIGMLMVYSTTFDYGLVLKDEATYYFERQFWALGLGLLAMTIIMQFDYHFFRRFSLLIMAITLIGLLVVLFLGQDILGAQRGFFEGSYQPSEVAKLATILYISHWLSSKGERIKRLSYGLIPFSIIVGTVCALIVRQPDLSTAGLIAMVSFTVFFVAGADWRQFAIAGTAAGGIFLFLITALPHAAARVDAYTAALRDPNQASWHVQQSLIALGRGGLTGVGLGESTQKFGPLPFAHTDGVFAILGEEMGLLGGMLVIGLFAMLMWRGFLAAKNARDTYGSLLAVGITCWIGYQTLINIAVITAVIPFTGIPLPFLSYGGSSLLLSLAAMGILLNVSRDAAMTKRPQPTRRPSPNQGSPPHGRPVRETPVRSRPRRS